MLLSVEDAAALAGQRSFLLQHCPGSYISGSCSAVCLSYEASAGTVRLGIATLGRNEESDWSHCLYDLLLKNSGVYRWFGTPFGIV